jgi:8-oxo-dGTP diphosphatase
MSGNAATAVPVIHVAVGVIRRHGRVLIARRPDHVHQGGLLEFPGGKVEPDETVQQALVREIHEETGLTVAPVDLTSLIGIRHDYGDKCVFLDVWEATDSEGEPEGKEGQAVEWRDPMELADEDFPAANRPIIRALRLPRCYAITGAASGPADYLQRLKHAIPTSGQQLCLLRAPELEQAPYRELVTQALRAAEWNRGVQWMLHGSPALLEAFPEAAGVHLPWREARLHQSRPVDRGYLLAVSCHNAREIRHAVAIGADFVTLGPVKPTASHPGTEPMAPDEFRDLVAGAPVVVYGLGGLDKSDLNEMTACCAQGIAGISYWWPGPVAGQ